MHSVFKLYLLYLLINQISGRVYNKCSFAKKLLDLDVPIKDIPTLVCIAQARTGFNTKYRDSVAWGLFGVHQNVWCHPNKDAVLTDKLVDIDKYKCLVTCHEILESVARSVTCAQSVLKTQGLNAFGFDQCANLDIKYLHECPKFMMLYSAINNYCDG